MTIDLTLKKKKLDFVYAHNTLNCIKYNREL